MSVARFHVDAGAAARGLARRTATCPVRAGAARGASVPAGAAVLFAGLCVDASASACLESRGTATGSGAASLSGAAHGPALAAVRFITRDVGAAICAGAAAVRADTTSRHATLTRRARRRAVAAMRLVRLHVRTATAARREPAGTAGPTTAALTHLIAGAAGAACAAVRRSVRQIDARTLAQRLTTRAATTTAYTRRTGRTRRPAATAVCGARLRVNALPGARTLPASAAERTHSADTGLPGRARGTTRAAVTRVGCNIRAIVAARRGAGLERTGGDAGTGATELAAGAGLTAASAVCSITHDRLTHAAARRLARGARDDAGPCLTVEPNAASIAAAPAVGAVGPGVYTGPRASRLSAGTLCTTACAAGCRSASAPTRGTRMSGAAGIATRTAAPHTILLRVAVVAAGAAHQQQQEPRTNERAEPPRARTQRPKRPNREHAGKCSITLALRFARGHPPRSNLSGERQIGISFAFRSQ
jgi:hypothetical protein